MLAMIITCLHCTTRYRVAARAFGTAARTVRCSNCGHLWNVQSPQVDQREDWPQKKRAAPVAAASPRPQATQHRAARSLRQDQRSDLREIPREAEADRVPTEPRGEPKKRTNTQAARVVGASATEEHAPPAPPFGPPIAATTGDEAERTAAQRVSESDAVRPGEPPDPFSVGTDEAGATNAPRQSALESAEKTAETSEASRSLEAAPEPAPAGRKRIILVALAATILVAGIGVLVIGRDAIEAAVSSLSAMVGLEAPPGAELHISAVTSFREETAGGDVLVVEGTVTNPTENARPLPAIRVALLDTEDAELQHVMVVPDQQVLVPGERFAFSARLEQPAPTARRIKVSFSARHGPT